MKRIMFGMILLGMIAAAYALNDGQHVTQETLDNIDFSTMSVHDFMELTGFEILSPGTLLLASENPALPYDIFLFKYSYHTLKKEQDYYIVRKIIHRRYYDARDVESCILNYSMQECRVFYYGKIISMLLDDIGHNRQKLINLQSSDMTATTGFFNEFNEDDIS